MNVNDLNGVGRLVTVRGMLTCSFSTDSGRSRFHWKLLTGEGTYSVVQFPDQQRKMPFTGKGTFHALVVETKELLLIGEDTLVVLPHNANAGNKWS